MIKYIVFTLVAFVVAPAFVEATEYHYVDTKGEVQTITAPSPFDALMIPSDIATNSGVTIDTGVIDDGDEVLLNNGSVLFQYVDNSGNIRFVQGSDATDALMAAPERAETSGVIRTDTSLIPPTTDVPI